MYQKKILNSYYKYQPTALLSRNLYDKNQEVGSYLQKLLDKIPRPGDRGNQNAFDNSIKTNAQFSKEKLINLYTNH